MLASGATRSQAGSGGTAGRGKAPPAHERHQLGVALANAPLDQGAENADGGLDREPEVAELTLGDGVAYPLERLATMLVARSSPPGTPCTWRCRTPSKRWPSASSPRWFRRQEALGRKRCATTAEAAACHRRFLRRWGASVGRGRRSAAESTATSPRNTSAARPIRSRSGSAASP